MFSEVVPPTSTSASVSAKAAGTIVDRSSRTAATASSPEGSPRTGTESIATRPSGERTIRPGAEARVGGQSRAEPRQRLLVRRIGWRPWRRRSGPGRRSLCGKLRWSAAKPCFDSNRSGNAVTPLVPIFIPKIGEARASRSATESARLSPGRRSTARTIAPQKRPSGLAASSERLPTSGIRSAVDAVAEDAEQRRQQRGRGDHRDDPDDDRADGEAAHDRARHDQHPEHRDHERRSAEDDGPVRGLADAAIASSFSRPRPRSSRNRERTKSA